MDSDIKRDTSFLVFTAAGNTSRCASSDRFVTDGRYTPGSPRQTGRSPVSGGPRLQVKAGSAAGTEGRCSDTNGPGRLPPG